MITIMACFPGHCRSAGIGMTQSYLPTLSAFNFFQDTPGGLEWESDWTHLC